MEAAFGSLCRELRRKMQLLIFKCKHGKCLIFFFLLCVVFPVALPCYFRSIPHLLWEFWALWHILSPQSVASLLLCSHWLSSSIFFDWRFQLMQNDIWLVLLAVKNNFCFTDDLCSLASSSLCGYWGLKCDLTKKDDQKIFCVTS